MPSPFKSSSEPVKHSLVAVVAKSDGVENEIRVDSNRSLSLVKQVLKSWVIRCWKPLVAEKKNENAISNWWHGGFILTKSDAEIFYMI